MNSKGANTECKHTPNNFKLTIWDAYYSLDATAWELALGKLCVLTVTLGVGKIRPEGSIQPTK